MGNKLQPRESQHGEFSRLVTLPGGLEPEKTEAHFENGLLMLTIPQAEKVRPKTIQVKTA